MILLGGSRLTLRDVARVARAPVAGSTAAPDPEAVVTLAPAAFDRLRASRAVIESAVARGDVVYGVTTGFGELKDRAIPGDQLRALQVNLLRSHAAGV
ncbi:MAG TPA: aromatic amino acid lyase, partial [Terriglobales bacterium]|nr:aromatic amino acid lyase [Terriglobales bacterium]